MENNSKIFNNTVDYININPKDLSLYAPDEFIEYLKLLSDIHKYKKISSNTYSPQNSYSPKRRFVFTGKTGVGKSQASKNTL